MARHKRHDFPGAYHHVMARGNRGEDIFQSDADRYDFLAIMADVCEETGWRCYAYCLMPNHYHLLIHTPDAGLSKGMRQLNGKFTQRSNWRNGTFGHVFQGRFKSILIENDSYFMELFRYIYMNPVKDGFAKTPQAWKWSSFRYQAGYQHRQEAPAWLEVSSVHKLFGGKKTEAARKLATFVGARAEISEKGRRNLERLMEKGGVYGSDGFVERHDPNGRYSNSGRDLCIVEAAQSGLSQEAIAKRFEVHRSTIHRVLAQSK